MHGAALVFMTTFWVLVLGLVVFVFCRMYCPRTEVPNATPRRESLEEEPEEVT